MTKNRKSYLDRKSSHHRQKAGGLEEKDQDKEKSGIRLNRYIARAGVSSRRKADELIEKGLVKVNDQVVTELGVRVQEGDKVIVGGKLISPQEHTYVLMNKPADTISTKSDERGRQTVLDLINIPEQEKSSLFPVGRLDRNTVGVLLLTNDGNLAHRLMHPRYGVEKFYRIRTKEKIKPHELEQLRKGVQLEDGIAKVERVEYIEPGNYHEIGMLLHEGRNRQVRRMMESLGHEVDYLERINYAGLTTEGIRRGRWRKLRPHEIRRLYNLVKLRP